MDYFAIIKKAYQITLKNKFLWIFGIFAGGMVGLSSGSNYSTTTPSPSNFNWAVFWNTWGTVVITFGIIVLAIWLILIILSTISQGALIGSVEKISKNEKTDFNTGFAIGEKHFWRILGVSVIFLLMILASLAVLFIPVTLSILGKMYVLAIIWGILVFFVDLAFWILVSLILPLSYRVIVFGKFGVWESIRESLHFFRKNWKKIVVMYLLLFAIGTGYGIALALALLFLVGLLLVIGFGVALASVFAALGYAILVGLAVFLAIIVISGAYNSFSSSVITLLYLELKK